MAIKNHLSFLAPRRKDRWKNNNRTTTEKCVPEQLQLRLRGAANRRTETLLELVNATFGVDKLFLAGEEGMGIRGNADGNHVVLHAVDHFFTIGSFGGARYHASASGHINKNHGIVIGMKIAFHEFMVRAVPTRGVGIVEIRSNLSSSLQKKLKNHAICRVQALIFHKN